MVRLYSRGGTKYPDVPSCESHSSYNWFQDRRRVKINWARAWRRDRKTRAPFQSLERSSLSISHCHFVISASESFDELGDKCPSRQPWKGEKRTNWWSSAPEGSPVLSVWNIRLHFQRRQTVRRSATLRSRGSRSSAHNRARDTGARTQSYQRWTHEVFLHDLQDDCHLSTASATGAPITELSRPLLAVWLVDPYRRHHISNLPWTVPLRHRLDQLQPSASYTLEDQNQIQR